MSLKGHTFVSHGAPHGTAPNTQARQEISSASEGVRGSRALLAGEQQRSRLWERSFVPRQRSESFASSHGAGRSVDPGTKRVDSTSRGASGNLAGSRAFIGFGNADHTRGVAFPQTFPRRIHATAHSEARYHHHSACSRAGWYKPPMLVTRVQFPVWHVFAFRMCF